jgi:two-component system heavy metal sensor histidine kinase CusS
MGANGVSLVDVVTSISSHWPAVAIRCESDAVLAIDRRAIESVVLNLVQNAISHGKAKEVHIHSRTAGEGRVEVSVENEGSPFSGDTALLGRLFQRFYSGSGSGVGLHLVETLVKRAGGTVRYEARSNGFAVRMLLPGMADGSAEK